MVAELGSLNLPLTEEKLANEFQFIRNSLSTIQGEYTSKLLKQGEALGEAMTMVKQLNAKVDAIKIQADLNDDYVKSQVDAKTIDIMDKITKLSQAGHTTWSELEAIKQRSNQYEEQLHLTNGQVSEILIRMKDLQAQTAYGASTGSPQGGQFNSNGAGGKNIMEYRSVSMMEKLTGEAKEFNIWSLRLKNTLKQINPIYATLLELIERLPTAGYLRQLVE